MPNHRVLVVEDDASGRDFLVRRLRAKNYELFAQDGNDDVIGPIRDIVPDAILLDIILPGGDGLEILKTIREYWSPQQMAVILVSALDSSEDVIRGLELGANDYVVKPINFPVLLARLRASLAAVDSFRKLTKEHETERKLAETKVLSDRLAGVLTQIKKLAGELGESAPLSGAIDQAQHLLDQQYRSLSFQPIELDVNVELLNVRDFR